MPKIPQGVFKPAVDISAPDYSDLKYWTASPLKIDKADRTPGDNFKNLQEEAKVDVFFLHPTTYTREKGNTEWNADLNDEDLNKKTDNGECRWERRVRPQEPVFTLLLFQPRGITASLFTHCDRLLPPVCPGK